MHVQPVYLSCTVLIGATGAVTSFVGSAIESVTRVSAGKYKIAFQPLTNFSLLYNAVATLQSPSSGFSGISTVEIQNAPNTDVASSTPSITVTCLAATNSSTTTLAATDPASGSQLNLLAILSNSSIKIGGE